MHTGPKPASVESRPCPGVERQTCVGLVASDPGCRQGQVLAGLRAPWLPGVQATGEDAAAASCSRGHPPATYQGSTARAPGLGLLGSKSWDPDAGKWAGEGTRHEELCWPAASAAFCSPSGLPRPPHSRCSVTEP